MNKIKNISISNMQNRSVDSYDVLQQLIYHIDDLTTMFNFSKYGIDAEYHNIIEMLVKAGVQFDVIQR